MCGSMTDSPNKRKRKQNKHHGEQSVQDDVCLENCEDDTNQKSPKKLKKDEDSANTPKKKNKSIADEEIRTEKKKKRKVKEGDDGKDDANEAATKAEKEGNAEAKISKAKKSFTVIRKVDELQRKKVERVLPYWLTNAIPILGDLKKPLEAADEMGFLDEHIKERLKANGVKHLFPVQRTVIPKILLGVSRRLYRPPDICVSSPTGSGKTLAFVLPIIQSLRSRIICRVMALVVLPVQSLALQVYKVFKTYAEGTKLNIGLVVGHTTVTQEQSSLVWKGETGWHSKVDVIVSTPGRLLEHIRNTEGFTLEHLKFLVLDEADRLVADESMDWLPAIYSSTKPGDRVLVPSQLLTRNFPPQKLLFSATLSSNPEKLQQLHLFQPVLFSSGTVSESNITESSTTKYTRPKGLQEYLVRVDAALKPLAFHHLVKERKWEKVLCFTNSRESTHRLSELMSSMGLNTKEFSAKIPSKDKQKLLKDFLSGKINVLISTDAMARGMDIAQVQVVINYDPPIQPKTYIHRVGRTARAGEKGVAVTLVSRANIKNVTQQLRKAGVGRLEEIQVEEDVLRPLESQYKEALQTLKQIVDEEEKESAKRRKRTLTRKALPLKIRRKATQKSVLKKKKSKMKANKVK